MGMHDVDNNRVKQRLVGFLGSYYAKRIGQLFLVFFIAVTITFALYRLMPSGPYEIMRSQEIREITRSGGVLTDAKLERINRQIARQTNLNPDRPIFVQYLNYMESIIVHQDFGESIRYSEPVFDVVFEYMPWSIFISFYGYILGKSTSLILGALMANYEGSRFDMGLTVWTIFNMSVPYYIVAILSIIVFSYTFGVFPDSRRFATDVPKGYNLEFMISVVRHSALPVLSMFIVSFGGALAFRGNCIREKGKEYIRVGRIRGISETRLGIRYIGRNSLLPIYTGLMMGIAGLFGGNVVVEKIFMYRGVGLVTFDALMNRDYPLLMGALIFFTLITLVGILIADLTYGLIDPRVSGGEERETY